MNLICSSIRSSGANTFQKAQCRYFDLLKSKMLLCSLKKKKHLERLFLNPPLSLLSPLITTAEVICLTSDQRSRRVSEFDLDKRTSKQHGETLTWLTFSAALTERNLCALKKNNVLTRSKMFYRRQRL